MITSPKYQQTNKHTKKQTNKHLSSKGEGVNMAFYISHDTFITGESKIVREHGTMRKGDPAQNAFDERSPDMKNLSKTDKQIVLNNVMKERLTPNSNKICVNASATKNKQEWEPKKDVTLTSVNTSMKEDDVKQIGDNTVNEDYSTPEGMKTDFYVQIETVENITLPLPRRAMKSVT